MYLPLGSSRLVRARYCFIGCIILALLLLAVNTHFLLFSTTNHSRQPPMILFEKDFSSRNVPINVSEVISDINSEDKLSHITSEFPKISTPPHNLNRLISLPDQSTNKALFSSIKHAQAEQSECEIMLAGSQWKAWNVVDLCLSSAGPFSFLLILNISIILRVTRQTSQTLRPGSVSERGSRRNTNATSASSPRTRSTANQMSITHRVTFRLSNSSRNPNSKAERSVTLMLLITTLAFLLLRTPTSIGHFIQILVSEERLYAFIEPVTCMVSLGQRQCITYR